MFLGNTLAVDIWLSMLFDMSLLTLLSKYDWGMKKVRWFVPSQEVFGSIGYQYISQITPKVGYILLLVIFNIILFVQFLQITPLLQLNNVKTRLLTCSQDTKETNGAQKSGRRHSWAHFFGRLVLSLCLSIYQLLCIYVYVYIYI